MLDFPSHSLPFTTNKREKEKKKKTAPPKKYLIHVVSHYSELKSSLQKKKKTKNCTHKYSKPKKQRKMLMKWTVVGLDLRNTSFFLSHFFILLESETE